MKDVDSNAQPIPQQWRVCVKSILREGNEEKIITTWQSGRDWEAAFPENSWDFIRFGAIANALENEQLTGRHITDMRDSGEIYAFWFYYRNKQLYAKINLLPDGRVIMIYSSHVPRKGTDKL